MGYSEGNGLMPGVNLASALVGGSPMEAPNELVTPPVSSVPSFEMNDVSQDAQLKNNGYFASNPTGMIIHHTSSNNGDINALISEFRKSGLGSQFAIGRDGKIYQLYPNGAIGHHIMAGFPGSVGEGRSNSNMEGVEIMAASDKDVLPVQAEAAARLVAARSRMWGWNPNGNVFGHGEVNPGHKEADEGMTVVNGIRNGTLALPDYSQTIPTMAMQDGRAVRSATVPRQIASVPLASDAQNQLSPGVSTSTAAPINVPAGLAPLINYWADYHGLDRDIFARMINRESSFNQNAPGGGLGQLIPGTAAHVGVKDPYDVSENLRGSAQYLREMLDHPRSKGDYRVALQMYNRGPDGVLDNPKYASDILGGGGGVVAQNAAQQSAGRPYAAEGALSIPPSTSTVLPPAAANAPRPDAPASGRGPYTPMPEAKSPLDDPAFKRALMLSMIGNAMKGMTFAPVRSGYDPFKVQKAAEPPPVHYTASIGSAGRLGAGIEGAYRPMQSPASPARAASPESVRPTRASKRVEGSA